MPRETALVGDASCRDAAPHHRLAQDAGHLDDSEEDVPELEPDDDEPDNIDSDVLGRLAPPRRSREDAGLQTPAKKKGGRKKTRGSQSGSRKLNQSVSWSPDT